MRLLLTHDVAVRSGAPAVRMAPDLSSSGRVTANRFVTDLTDQDAATTEQVVRLANDPRCLVEITAVAVID